MPSYLADTEDSDLAVLSGTYTSDEANKVITFGVDGEADTGVTLPTASPWLLIEVYDVEDVAGAKGYHRYTTNVSNIDAYITTARTISLAEYTTFKIIATHYKGDGTADIYYGDESTAASLGLADKAFTPPATWEITDDTISSPPTESVIVPTLADIWYNSNTAQFSVNFPSGANATHELYATPVESNFPSLNSTAMNPWSLTAQEAISGCSLGIGTSVNTGVEVGSLIVWWLYDDGTWHLVHNSKVNGSNSYPNSSDPYTNTVGCTTGDVYDLRLSNIGYDPTLSLSADGYSRFLPKYSYWSNGFGGIMNLPAGVKAQFVQQYFRLTKVDPLGADDRDLARFVHCVGANNRDIIGTNHGRVGTGRWRRAANAWQSATMLTGGYFNSFAEFEANAPQIATTPDGSLLPATEPPPSPEPPPSEGGIIENSMQLIYNDMALLNDLYPTGKPSGYGQFWSGRTGKLATQVEEWTKCNLWYEFDLQQPTPISCAVGMISYPNNTCIEVSKGNLWWLDDNGFPATPSSWTWRHGIVDNVSHLPNGPIHYAGKGCTDQTPFADARATMPSDYSPSSSTVMGVGHINIEKLPNGNVKVNPVNGWRYHSWYGNTPIDRTRIQCIYGCVWVRLVLIDPNGTDDRHLYDQVVHISSDIRNDQNVFPVGYEMWSVGGLTRYKKIPNNGDWMPVNFIIFRQDATYGGRDENGDWHQTTLQRIIDVNPPIMMAPPN